MPFPMAIQLLGHWRILYSFIVFGMWSCKWNPPNLSNIKVNVAWAKDEKVVVIEAVAIDPDELVWCCATKRLSNLILLSRLSFLAIRWGCWHGSFSWFEECWNWEWLCIRWWKGRIQCAIGDRGAIFVHILETSKHLFGFCKFVFVRRDVNKLEWMRSIAIQFLLAGPEFRYCI